MNPISAIIVAKDNPLHIIEAVESIKDFVKEIIVVDLGINPELKKNYLLIPCFNLMLN